MCVCVCVCVCVGGGQGRIKLVSNSSVLAYLRIDVRNPVFAACLQTNTGADQTALMRSLISACVICLLESSICKLATSELSFSSKSV